LCPKLSIYIILYAGSQCCSLQFPAATGENPGKTLKNEAGNPLYKPFSNIMYNTEFLLYIISET